MASSSVSHRLFSRTLPTPRDVSLHLLDLKHPLRPPQTARQRSARDRNERQLLAVMPTVVRPSRKGRGEGAGPGRTRKLGSASRNSMSRAIGTRQRSERIYRLAQGQYRSSRRRAFIKRNPLRRHRFLLLPLASPRSPSSDPLMDDP
jgi:hypothetical protein